MCSYHNTGNTCLFCLWVLCTVKYGGTAVSSSTSCSYPCYYRNHLKKARWRSRRCCNLNLPSIHPYTQLTLSRFQINCVCDDIFQFHEFQLGCFDCNPAVRADFDPFPLITTSCCWLLGVSDDCWRLLEHTNFLIPSRAQHTKHRRGNNTHPHHKRGHNSNTRGCNCNCNCNHCRLPLMCGYTHERNTGCVYLNRPHANDTSPYDLSVC